MSTPIEPHGPPSQTVLNDRYELRARLGSGASGTVYRAIDRSLESEVALKCIHRHLVQSDAAKELLVQELLAGQSVNHPNIVRTFGHFTDQDTDAIILVMELVNGVPLDRCFDQILDEDRFPFARLLIEQLVSAVSHLHANGLLHCDIKPSNILVEPRGSLKLIDFSVATALHEVSKAAARATSAKTRAAPQGTLAYMAPELIRGASPSPQSDLYAVGVVGKTLLREAGHGDSSPRPSILGFRKVRAFPKAVEKLHRALDWCTRAEPRERPASAAELARAIEGTVRPPRPRRRRRARKIAALASAFILGLGAAHNGSKAPIIERAIKLQELVGIDPGPSVLLLSTLFGNKGSIAAGAIQMHQNETLRELLRISDRRLGMESERVSKLLPNPELACRAIRSFNNEALELLAKKGFALNGQCAQVVGRASSSFLLPPLLVAYGNGNDEAIPILLRHGANLDDAVERDRAKVFFILSQYGSSEAFRAVYSALQLPSDFHFDEFPYALYLATSFAPQRLKDAVALGLNPNAVSETGLTSLHIAIARRMPRAVETLLDAPGIDPYRPSNDGRLPLFLLGDMPEGGAVLQRLVTTLADRGIDPNIPLADERTLTGYLVLSSTPEALADILEFPGLLVGAAGPHGETPLHIATERKSGAGEVIKLLLSHHVPVDAKNLDGRTALDLAYARENREAIAALEASGAVRSVGPAGLADSLRSSEKRARKIRYEE